MTVKEFEEYVKHFKLPVASKIKQIKQPSEIRIRIWNLTDEEWLKVYNTAWNMKRTKI